MSDRKPQQLAAGLDRNEVTLTVTCRNRYEAMELYDRLCSQAKQGFVELELETVPRD